MKVVHVLKFFFHFFGTAAESVAEGGVPSGVPVAEDGAKGPTKMKKNVENVNNLSLEHLHFFRVKNFFN